jgi:anti-sigma B factor antagonist
MQPMASETSRLRIKKINDVIQVEFIDRNILDEANIQLIGEEITSLIDSTPKPKLLISFTNVDHLSSAALGTLITINNKVRNASGQLRLSDIDPQIYEVFVITKLNKLFEIHETAAEAIKSFR